MRDSVLYRAGMTESSDFGYIYDGDTLNIVTVGAAVENVTSLKMTLQYSRNVTIDHSIVSAKWIT